MKKQKKLRRVVLGVGYPWFYCGNHQTDLRLFNSRGPKAISSKHIWSWNKIRLVAEVIK